MPLYEYHCEDCGRNFEMLRPISQADNPVSCPRGCQGKVRRLPALVNAFSAGKSVTNSSNSCGSCNSGNCSHCG